MRAQIFLNKGAVTVDISTQLKHALSNRERIMAIINYPSIHATLIISVLNVTAGNIYILQMWIGGRKTVHIKAIHRRYTRLWHAFILMKKALEYILETTCK